MKKRERSPWAWIPSLYFAEGIPYVAVMTISVIMYKRLGLTNTEIALYTSWLYLPWVIKPLWSPFVDLLKTKRWWIVSMQMLIGAGLAGIAFSIPTPFYVQASLAFFWLLAFSSATHDIAADGFYMLALPSDKQALYIGVRNVFYRVASITGQGLLIILAGALESATGSAPAIIHVDVNPNYKTELCIPVSQHITPQTNKDLAFVVYPQVLDLGTNPVDADSAKILKKYAQKQNYQNGFVNEDESLDITKIKDESWWTQNVSQPIGNFLKNHFGEESLGQKGAEKAGNIGIVQVRLSKPPKEGETIVLNTTQNQGNQNITLVAGERVQFTTKNWNKPALLVVQVDPKLKERLTASFKGVSGKINFAWSITFFVIAGMFLTFFVYHRFMLPRPDSDKSSLKTKTDEAIKAKDIFREFGITFKSFFTKRHALIAIFFMLTYRLAESQLLKVIQPFLLDPHVKGGLGLSVQEVGLAYGVFGVCGLVLGGIIGGVVAARYGLKKCLWPMMLSMLLPCFIYTFLSFTMPHNLLIVHICIIIEQFGYGFGFTAYMLYLMYYAEGEHKTAHYAICTGFMALGMMLPGVGAGWIQDHIGYQHFFLWVMSCSIIPMIVVSLLKIDPEYGKSKKK